MTPRPFTESKLCRSGEACSPCQDPGTGGRTFRLSLLRTGMTGLPPDGDAPACPFGMRPPSLTPPTGVGRWLRRMLGWFGITSVVGCSCDAQAAEMDLRGPAWCWAGRRAIVGRMGEEAARRGMRFNGTAAGCLLATAIVVAWVEGQMDEMTRGPRTAGDGRSKTI